MTEPQTVVEGERTITHHPEKPETDRWVGQVDHDAYRDHAWHGRTVEQVIGQMEKALGPIEVPDQPTKYAICE